MHHPLTGQSGPATNNTSKEYWAWSYHITPSRDNMGVSLMLSIVEQEPKGARSEVPDKRFLGLPLASVIFWSSSKSLQILPFDVRPKIAPKLPPWDWTLKTTILGKNHTNFPSLAYKDALNMKTGNSGMCHLHPQGKCCYCPLNHYDDQEFQMCTWKSLKQWISQVTDPIHAHAQYQKSNNSASDEYFSSVSAKQDIRTAESQKLFGRSSEG